MSEHDDRETQDVAALTAWFAENLSWEHFRDWSDEVWASEVLTSDWLAARERAAGERALRDAADEIRNDRDAMERFGSYFLAKLERHAARIARSQP